MDNIYNDYSEFLSLVKAKCPNYGRISNPSKKQEIDGGLFIWSSDNNISSIVINKLFTDKQIREINAIIAEGMVFDYSHQKPEKGIDNLYKGVNTKKHRHSGKVGAGVPQEIKDSSEEVSENDEQQNIFYDGFLDDNDVKEIDCVSNEEFPIEYNHISKLPYFEDLLFNSLNNMQMSCPILDNNYSENGKKILQKRIAIRLIWMKKNIDYNENIV